MNAIDQLLANAKALNDALERNDVQREVMESHRDDIMELQQIQLLEGKDSSGEDLRPYYSEDLKPMGYFHSKESAGRYAAWKGTLSYPFTVSRNADAPNLYITGVFHSELDVQLNPDTVAIIPTTVYAQGIMAKYGQGSFGLNRDKWAELMDERGGMTDLMTKVKNILWKG